MKLIARYTKCIITHLNHLFSHRNYLSFTLFLSAQWEAAGFSAVFFFPLNFYGTKWEWIVLKGSSDGMLPLCGFFWGGGGFGYGFFFVSLWKSIGVLLSLPFEEEFWLVDEDVRVLTGDRGDIILESHQQRESECLAFWLKKAHVLEQVI